MVFIAIAQSNAIHTIPHDFDSHLRKNLQLNYNAMQCDAFEQVQRNQWTLLVSDEN